MTPCCPQPFGRINQGSHLHRNPTNFLNKGLENLGEYDTIFKDNLELSVIVVPVEVKNEYTERMQYPLQLKTKKFKQPIIQDYK